MDQPSSATHGHFLSKLRQKSVNKLDFLLGQNISRSRNDLALHFKIWILLIDAELKVWVSILYRWIIQLKRKFRTSCDFKLYPQIQVIQMIYVFHSIHS